MTPLIPTTEYAVCSYLRGNLHNCIWVSPNLEINSDDFLPISQNTPHIFSFNKENRSSDFVIESSTIYYDKYFMTKTITPNS